MPAAVPEQQGIIGQYNNSTSPGVYVSWDSNPNFNSSFSVVFKGLENTDYRFPLIVNSYTQSGISTTIGTPIALGAGNTYIYCVNQNSIMAFQKIGDNFVGIASVTNSVILPSYTPNTIKVLSQGNQDLIIVGYYQGLFNVVTFNGSSFVTADGLYYSALCGISTTYYTNYDIALNNKNIYFSYLSNVYESQYTLDSSNDFTRTGGPSVIINSTNGLIAGSTTKKLAYFNNSKLALVDNNNVIYEFLYDGNTGAGNTTSVWTLNYTLAPTSNQIWSAMIYNNFGVIVASDSYNQTLNVIAAGNVTTNTKNYGTYDGVTYQVISTASTTVTQGVIANTIGSVGVGYLQFNGPNSLTEDPEYNIVIGDLNNRLTYLPTALTFVDIVGAPLNEMIDTTGNPADIYYVKQSTYDFTTVVSVPPLIGDELLLKSSVLYELNALLKVPVYDEEPLYDYKRQSATVAYGDIVTDPSPIVRITCSTNQGQNDAMVVISPFNGVYNTLDQSNSNFDMPVLVNNYPNGLYYRFTNNGKIYFFDVNGNPVSVQQYDTILVSYYVKLFTNRQINNALYLALQAINAQPGLNKIFSVRSCPFYYDQTLVSGATYYLLRQLLVGLNQRERRLLVQDDGGFDVMANLKELCKFYNDEYAILLKQLPIAKRPVLNTIAGSGLSFPGGRGRMFRNLWASGS